MKIAAIGMLLLISLNSFALDEQAGDVCMAWNEYTSEKQMYESVKAGMAQQGLDINEIEPETGRKVKALKSRFDMMKRKYESKTKRKFNKKQACDW